MYDESPQNVYAAVRAENPSKPYGDHWEGIGAYLGDGVWADPSHVGIRGEYEILHRCGENADDGSGKPAKRPRRRI